MKADYRKNVSKSVKEVWLTEGICEASSFKPGVK